MGDEESQGPSHIVHIVAKDRGDKTAELAFLVRLGEIYETKLKDTAKAIEIYEQLVHRDDWREFAHNLAGAYLNRANDLHALGRHDTAHQAYSHALDAGIPAPRVLPYLAELAFEVQDYGLVRRIMERMQGWQGQSGLTQVISYWTHMQ